LYADRDERVGLQRSGYVMRSFCTINGANSHSQLFPQRAASRDFETRAGGTPMTRSLRTTVCSPGDAALTYYLSQHFDRVVCRRRLGRSSRYICLEEPNYHQVMLATMLCCERHLSILQRPCPLQTIPLLLGGCPAQNSLPRFLSCALSYLVIVDVYNSLAIPRDP